MIHCMLGNISKSFQYKFSSCCVWKKLEHENPCGRMYEILSFSCLLVPLFEFISILCKWIPFYFYKIEDVWSVSVIWLCIIWLHDAQASVAFFLMRIAQHSTMNCYYYPQVLKNYCLWGYASPLFFQAYASASPRGLRMRLASQILQLFGTFFL